MAFGKEIERIILTASEIVTGEKMFGDEKFI
jgi:hypothetical protein